MYTKVDELIWTDEKFKTLSDDGKFLFFYILTCPHRNVIGLYFLPIPYGSFDLGWTAERFTEGLRELSEKGMIKHNSTTNIIFIPNFLKYNPLENPNQVKGAINAISKIPSSGLDSAFIKTLQTLNKPFLEPLIELLQERLAKHIDIDVDIDVAVDKGLPPLLDNKNLKRISTAYKNNGFGNMFPNAGQSLLEFADQYTIEWVEMALQKAAMLGKRNIAYVEGILKGWERDGQPSMEIRGQREQSQPDYFKPLEYEYED